MGDEDELELDASGLDDLRGAGQDLHPVPDGVETSHEEPPAPLLLDHAHAAGPVGHEPLVVTEGGDLDPRLGRGLQDHRSRGNGDLHSVNGQRYHLFFFSHSELALLMIFHHRDTEDTEKKLENWNDGILEEPMVCPSFHCSIIPFFLTSVSLW
jgi:hypothetical protein